MWLVSCLACLGVCVACRGYASDWDVWFDQFQQAFSRWPLMVGTGNHERDFKGTGDAFGDTARDSGAFRLGSPARGAGVT